MTEAISTEVPAQSLQASDETSDPSLGTQLRLAREAAGHSVTDVVQVLRFSAHQIEALERDDYASLPGATSARGLVRSYAKYLKLDPVPLLALLEPAVPVPAADVRPPTNMGEAEEISIKERVSPRILAVSGALIALVLGAVWFLEGAPESAGVNTSAVMPQASSRVAPSSAEPAVALPNATVVAAVDPPPNSTEPAAPAPAAGLRIEFDERSWIEVRDASHKVVLVGEYSAGARHNVDGKAPFQLWIGKASGVRVFMGERSIDLKPHTREEVARLTLE